MLGRRLAVAQMRTGGPAENWWGMNQTITALKREGKPSRPVDGHLDHARLGMPRNHTTHSKALQIFVGLLYSPQYLRLLALRRIKICNPILRPS
jgi:hypothetical protein